MGSETSCRDAVVFFLLLNVCSPVTCQQILIKHKPDAAAAILQQASKFKLTPVVQTNGLTVMKNSAKTQLKPGKVKSLLEKARRWPGVEAAEEDQPRYMHWPQEEQQQRPNQKGCADKNLALSDNPVPEYQPYGIAQIQANSSKLPGRTDDKGMLICIIDSGLDFGHPDLIGNNIDGCKYEDTFAPAGCPFYWDQDLVGHGTHVAGTTAAQRNGQGVIGVIPGPAEIYIVRVFNNSGDVNQGQGLVYGSTVILAFTQCEGRLDAMQSAHPTKQYRMVVSMSLGAPGPLTIERMYFREAIKRGDILFVASSGNNGTAETLLPDGETTTDVNPGNYPGSYPEVIAVSAVDCNNNLAPFSQKNPSVDIAAPGVQILSTASRNDMPPGIRLGGFASTSNPKLKIQAMGNGASQLGESGIGKFTGKVVDCGTGSAPCPAAKDSICLIQYDPKMKAVTNAGPSSNPSRPPRNGAAAGGRGTAPAATAGSRGRLPVGRRASAGRNGVQSYDDQALYGSWTGAAQSISDGRPAMRQQGQVEGPASVIKQPSSFYCEFMEFCMKQGAKGMLLGPASLQSGYYGSDVAMAGDFSDAASYIKGMPILATFDCEEAGCSCWNRIKNTARLPAAALSLQQYADVKAAVAAANKAGKPFEGTVESQVGAYKSLSGTSMAVPHVTGAIARVWAVYPNCKSDVVRAAFEQTAKDLGPKGKDVQFGNGLVQAEAAFEYLAKQPCAKGPQTGELSADEKTQLGQ